jgi:hypothetical protein
MKTVHEKAQIAHNLLNGQEGYLATEVIGETVLIYINSRQFYEEVAEPFQEKGYKVYCVGRPK